MTRNIGKGTKIEQSMTNGSDVDTLTPMNQWKDTKKEDAPDNSSEASVKALLHRHSYKRAKGIIFGAPCRQVGC